MSKFVCIYHGNCADGFGAAAVIHKAFGEKRLLALQEPESTLELVAGVYQKEPNLQQLENAHVIMVDFCYKRPVMVEISKVAASLTWIDHHKSAIEQMQDFYIDSQCSFRKMTTDERSGAYLTWMYYFGENALNPKIMPRIIEHIDDRDRWVFALPKTREIQAAIFSYPYDMGLYQGWLEAGGLAIEHGMMATLAQQGTGIERKHFKDIHELLELCWGFKKVGGYNVPVANLPYTLASDAGHIMAEYPGYDHAFAATYYVAGNGDCVFSLRSVGDFDVSAIAKLYGGGGHKNASGFRVGFYNVTIEQVYTAQEMANPNPPSEPLKT